jgi:cyclase
MLRRRVIPCLDVADGRVVKGTRFVDLVDAGDPPELAERYAAEGADELVFLDITAAPERRSTLLDIVERTARRAFIPLTVGGGVRTVAEMRDVLRAGADKVSFNTAAVADPTLISRCAARFGRQAVVVAIDALAVAPGVSAAAGSATGGPAGGSGAQASPSWQVVVKGGREATGLDVVEWAGRAVELGAGELLVTSIDRDGTGSGFDTDLLRAITSSVGVPVIASGGAAGPDDFVRAVRDGGADAVLAASIFHRRIHSIADVKTAMAGAGLPIRLAPQAVA